MVVSLMNAELERIWEEEITRGIPKLTEKKNEKF
jgi:hypothetical protein